MGTKILDRRQAARREDLAEALMPFVEMLLGDGGTYLDLRVEDVITVAGISRSTFYRYFDDKNDLLLAVAASALKIIATAAFEPWDLPADATREDRRASMKHTFAAYRPHIPIVRAIVEVSTYDPELKALYEAEWESARRNAADRIRAGQRAGYVRAHLPPDETAAWLTWMAERGLYQLIPHADDATIDRLIDSLTAVFWHTIYEDEQPAEPLGSLGITGAMMRT